MLHSMHFGCALANDIVLALHPPWHFAAQGLATAEPKVDPVDAPPYMSKNALLPPNLAVVALPSELPPVSMLQPEVEHVVHCWPVLPDSMGSQTVAMLPQPPVW